MNDKTMKEIIEESFGVYAGAVAQSRAFVDVRDALKPSNRQINYCLYTDKFLPNKPFKKTLKAIGSIARVYIHGDSSAEGIIMRSGQPFALRYPLMEVEGNGGNLMMSGNWAAPRYTGSRLSHFGTMMFEDIAKETISEWRDNYDDTEKYPAVLPSKGFYNIVNGTSGIGVGVASSIPQFNLREVNTAMEKLLLNPDISFDEIYCVPDFATGGYLINEKEVKETLRYGSKKEAKKNDEDGAACKLRAKIDYDKKTNCLTVTEIPYSVYTNTICKQLESILEDSEINPGIDRFNDLTGEKPLLKIYLNKDAEPGRVINFLYKNTSLQYHYAINMTMLENGKYPKVFSWKEALQSHINHEKEVYRKGFEFDLNKIKARIHIIDGLLICLASIDEVVKEIKSSNSTSDASKALQSKFLLDEVQAKAVLDMKLARLANLEVNKLKDELKELEEGKNRILKILNDTTLFNNEIIKTWRAVSDKYGDARRTEVITVAETKEEKEIENVIPEDVVVVATQSGLIKKVPTAAFKVQRKGGKGVKSDEDAILDIIKTNTVDTIMFFTNKGKMYRTVADNIPDGTNASKGVLINNIVKFENNEKVMAISSLHRKSTPKYIIFITKNGMIKKSYLEEYTKTNRNTGITALKVKEGDEVVDIIFQDEEEMILITKNGMCIRFDTKSINPIGRNAMGVVGIKLNEGDEVVAGLPVHKTSDEVGIFSSTGLGKKVSLKEISSQTRGGKGTIIYKTSEQNGIVIGSAMLSDEDNILVSGNKTSICISAKEVPSLGKTSIGNIMIKDNKVLSITKL